MSLKDNFKNTVDITEMNVENKFSRYIEGTESMSSRTMIRNKIEAYQEGEISFLELGDYTQEKYSDGVKVLENDVAAFRVTDDQVVAQWGSYDSEEFSPSIKADQNETIIEVMKSESLVMIDVDYFKEINDNYGHLLDDKILKRISEIIKNEVRTIDLFGRYGDDEFMILSPETNIDEAINLAKRLKTLLEKEKFPKVENVSCRLELKIKTIEIRIKFIGYK